MTIFQFILWALMFAYLMFITRNIEQSERKIMSALKDTLDALTAKLAAIDEKIKALVAASATDTLAPETQAALDALAAEVATVGTDAGIPPV